MQARHYGFSLVLAALLAAPALAQGRQSDPNISHFYMARQQITITDDSPVVQNKVNGAPGAGGGQGALMNAPMGLPKAGWMPYSQEVPGLRTNLPATNNGVPQKQPPPATQHRLPIGQRGRGALLRPENGSAGGKSSAPKPPANPNSVQSYAPYKQYAPESPASGSAALNSNSAVRGSVLHWARSGRH
jgi:hypothetical protein